MDLSTDPELPLMANFASGWRFAGDARGGGSEASTYAVKIQGPRGRREGVTWAGTGRPLYRQGVELVGRDQT